MSDSQTNNVDVLDDVVENIDDIDERILIEFFQTLFKDNPFSGMSKILSRTDNFPELANQGLGGFDVEITTYDITSHPFYDKDVVGEGEVIDCWHIALTRTSVFNALVTVNINNE